MPKSSGPSRWRRVGAEWSDRDHEQLIAAIRDGLADEDVADRLGRTTIAVASRARRMLPTDLPRVSSRRSLEVLRELVMADPDYDWRAHVATAIAAEGGRYWTDADCDRVRRGWEDRTPLPELASAIDVSEVEVVRKIVAMDLATNLVDVTDRLGCEPGGVVETRRRLAIDRAAAQVWVLAIHGLPDRAAHISLHTSRDEAVARRDELAAPVRETDTGSAVVWWCIAQRSPGDEVGPRAEYGELAVGTPASPPR